MRPQCLIHQVQGLHREVVAANVCIPSSKRWNSRRDSSRRSLLSTRLGTLLSSRLGIRLRTHRRSPPKARCPVWHESADFLAVVDHWKLETPFPISTSTVSQDICTRCGSQSMKGSRTNEGFSSRRASRIKSWRFSGIASVRCGATSEACTQSLLICSALNGSTLRPLKAATSTASCSAVMASYWNSGTVGIEGLAIAAVEARRQLQRQSEQSTVALRKQSEETFRGNTLISFRKVIVSDSPLHWVGNLHRSHSIRHSMKPVEKTISVKIQSHHSRSASLAFLPIGEIISNRKTLSFSPSLFLWFWALGFSGFSGFSGTTKSAHAVMTSTASLFPLYIPLFHILSFLQCSDPISMSTGPSFLLGTTRCLLLM